jgi:hypothetical protein
LPVVDSRLRNRAHSAGEVTVFAKEVGNELQNEAHAVTAMAAAWEDVTLHRDHQVVFTVGGVHRFVCARSRHNIARRAVSAA